MKGMPVFTQTNSQSKEYLPVIKHLSKGIDESTSGDVGKMADAQTNIVQVDQNDAVMRSGMQTKDSLSTTKSIEAERPPDQNFGMVPSGQAELQTPYLKKQNGGIVFK